MLKSKIAKKLSINFAAVLLCFALIVGSVFFFLFRNYTVEMHKLELQNYAQSLADTLSGESNHGFGKRMGGYGAYLRLIGEVSDTDVWVVDDALNLVIVGKGQGETYDRYTMSELPSDASEVIDKVFQGETVFSEGFSDLFSTFTLTVGVPVRNLQGNILGAVLLHSPVNETAMAVQRGLVVLMVSILVALIASTVLSLMMSYSFTKPLSKMKAAAIRLAKGDYTARCNVEQDDEIGDLSEVLDLLANCLDHASKESQKLEQMRRDFVANISHELRTPVTVIRGSLEALCDKVIDTPEKVEVYHNQMLEEAKFLERLVRDLLDLSRLQNTDFMIQMSPVNICDVMADVARSASRVADRKGVSVSTNTQSFCTQNSQMQGDYGRLRQMFMIVLDNAIKFSPEGGQVDIEVMEHRVTIRDYGSGIESEHLPHIFDRFYKTHGEQNKSGTGLGLAIAKQIANRHGIILSATNHSKGGAEFVFELPQIQS